MNKNPFGVIGIILCLIVVVYSGSKVFNADRDMVASEANFSVIMNQSGVKVSSSSAHSETDKNTASVSQGKSISELPDFKGLSEERGYISAEDMAIYQGYDLETLKTLASGGDLRAVDALAAIAVKSGDIEKANAYYWRAGAMGSTAALGHMALLAEPSGFIEMSDHDRKEKIMEVMAILKLAEMRGDLQVATVIAKGVTTSYESSFGPLSFSDEEITRIQVQAQKLYEELKLYRSQMGLNDFDNSIPKVSEEIYKIQ